ncbi:unnamed protein product [Discosporangium mesarthrocarpum]
MFGLFAPPTVTLSLTRKKRPLLAKPLQHSTVQYITVLRLSSTSPHLPSNKKAVVFLVLLAKKVWWADSLTGLFLSVYILLEGLKSIHEAYSQWTMHPWGDEGLRLVPMMHERVRGEGADEESALLQETI